MNFFEGVHLTSDYDYIWHERNVDIFFHNFCNDSPSQKGKLKNENEKGSKYSEGKWKKWLKCNFSAHSRWSKIKKSYSMRRIFLFLVMSRINGAIANRSLATSRFLTCAPSNFTYIQWYLPYLSIQCSEQTCPPCQNSLRHSWSPICRLEIVIVISFLLLPMQFSNSNIDFYDACRGLRLRKCENQNGDLEQTLLLLLSWNPSPQETEHGDQSAQGSPDDLIFFVVVAVVVVGVGGGCGRLVEMRTGGKWTVSSSPPPRPSTPPPSFPT